MRIDYGDWKVARDALIDQLEARAWRHGITTDAAIAWVLAYGGFPADPADMFERKWRKKNAAIWKFTLYYFNQSGLKNRYFARYCTASRKNKRFRAIFNVEHGVAPKKAGSNGVPPPSKQGIWLYWKDMHRADAMLARDQYRGRGSDAKNVRDFLGVIDVVLEPLPPDAVAGDVEDEIFRRL